MLIKQINQGVQNHSDLVNHDIIKKQKAWNRESLKTNTCISDNKRISNQQQLQKQFSHFFIFIFKGHFFFLPEELELSSAGRLTSISTQLQYPGMTATNKHRWEGILVIRFIDFNLLNNNIKMKTVDKCILPKHSKIVKRISDMWKWPKTIKIISRFEAYNHTYLDWSNK